jgi:hypothetical protein
MVCSRTCNVQSHPTDFVKTGDGSSFTSIWGQTIIQDCSMRQEWLKKVFYNLVYDLKLPTIKGPV